MTQTVKETLEKAKANLEKYGWCQGVYKNSKGNLCVEGALIRAFGNPERDITHDIEAEYASILKETRGLLEKVGNLGDLVIFNDTKGRTKEDILALFDKALEGLEK